MSLRKFLQAGERVASRIALTPTSYPNANMYHGFHYYKIDMILEALLEYGVVSGRDAYRAHVERILFEGGITYAFPLPYQAQPFTAINYAIYRLTGDARWLPIFVRETSHLRREIPRSPEGAALYRSRVLRKDNLLLIDNIQEYVARMARCGSITRDASYFDEAVHQLVVCHDLLRDRQTGLWRQGRGWVDGSPEELSPGAWSRGNGWLLRGIVEALSLMPPRSEAAAQVQQIAVELGNALLPLQDGEGMWHTLLHLPLDDSAPETSGTALISTALGRAWREGYVTDEAWRDAALRGFSGLANYVDVEGNVLSTSPGPGPLFEEASYKRQDFPPNDQHGEFSILFAASEAIQFDRLKR